MRILTSLIALLALFPFVSRASAGPALSGASLPPSVVFAAPAPPPPPSKEWTVMFFVNGKNNLETSALTDVNHLEQLGTTPAVNITVELGRMKGLQEGDDASDGDWTGVRRYLITRDTDAAHIASRPLDVREKADMGDWKELADFISWSKRNFPAKRYMLLIWDHGNGWKPLKPDGKPGIGVEKSISLDDETGHEISITRVKDALLQTGGVHLLMADACLMQMASVAYELKDQAEVMVGSEESEPGVVERYVRFLSALDAEPSQTTEAFAAEIVRSYRDYFQSAGYPKDMQVTQSALRLKKMTGLRERLDAWARLALYAGEKDLLRTAKDNCKKYDDADYKDLHHFISLVTEGTRNKALRDAGRSVLDHLTGEVVAENWAMGPDSRGLSIYLPETYSPLYDDLSWSKDGLWDDFAKFLSSPAAI